MATHPALGAFYPARKRQAIRRRAVAAPEPRPTPRPDRPDEAMRERAIVGASMRLARVHDEHRCAGLEAKHFRYRLHALAFAACDLLAEVRGPQTRAAAVWALVDTVTLVELDGWMGDSLMRATPAQIAAVLDDYRLRARKYALQRELAALEEVS